MGRSIKRWLPVSWGIALPVAAMLLFRQVKGDQKLMDRWVFGVLAPVEQCLGRICSVAPFSVAEVLAVLLVLGGAGWLIRGVVCLVRERQAGLFLRRLLALGAVCLWLLAGLDWLWNAGYYATGLAGRIGLEVREYSVEELYRVTSLFAVRANELSTQVERDGGGHFALSRKEILARGQTVYAGIAEQFPALGAASVRAKPLLSSQLQSILGFTGIYMPFTGEANVNVAAPACLLPATIAHEMAHQRMVAPEQEANFAGIAACITCEDTTFRYSGYLMGLIHLSNALYSAAPNLWRGLRADFSNELITDWNDNNAYWVQLQSPVEQAAGNAYDSFLKGNDQNLGMRSYGACVDLLVAWLGGSV